MVPYGPYRCPHHSIWLHTCPPCCMVPYGPYRCCCVSIWPHTCPPSYLAPIGVPIALYGPIYVSPGHTAPIGAPMALYGPIRDPPGPWGLPGPWPRPPPRPRVATPICALERRYWPGRATPPGVSAAAGGVGQRSRLPEVPAPAPPLPRELSIMGSASCDWPRHTAPSPCHSSRRRPRVGRAGRLLPCDWATRQRSVFLLALATAGVLPLRSPYLLLVPPLALRRFPLASPPVTHLKPRLPHGVPAGHWPAAPLASIGLEALPIRPLPRRRLASSHGAGRVTLSSLFPLVLPGGRGVPAASLRAADWRSRPLIPPAPGGFG